MEAGIRLALLIAAHINITVRVNITNTKGIRE
jgi:hypothetical protein